LDRFRTLLAGLKRALVHRALVAWEQSPETFGEEIVALNDIDETLGNKRSNETSFKMILASFLASTLKSALFSTCWS